MFFITKNTRLLSLPTTNPLISRNILSLNLTTNNTPSTTTTAVTPPPTKPDDTTSSSSLAKPPPISYFFDSFRYDAHGRFIGRAWKAEELRLKSFDDLHGLFFVLVRERNKLLSEKRRDHIQGTTLARFDRLKKVRQSMARILTIINERSREYKATKLTNNNSVTTTNNKDKKHHTIHTKSANRKSSSQ
jgi:large subunit ribosomal protein L47